MALPQTLIRLLEERSGFQLRPEFVEEWCRASAHTDREAAYRALLQDALNTDLHKTSRSVIGDDFGQRSPTTFPERRGGCIVLQIQDALDISVSAHSLLNQLATVTPVRQVYTLRQADEPIRFTRGMLRWTLTDGHKQIQATEIDKIPDLNLTTPFGCKIIVKGCTIRRGMLMLDKNNVKVLGGQVPELYGGNMTAELERRFKMRLGLTVEAATEVQPNNQPIQVQDDIDLDDAFDLDDDALQRLEAMEMDAIQATTHQSIDSDTDIAYFDDGPPSPLFSPSRESPFIFSPSPQNPSSTGLHSPSPPPQLHSPPSPLKSPEPQTPSSPSLATTSLFPSLNRTPVPAQSPRASASTSSHNPPVFKNITAQYAYQEKEPMTSPISTTAHRTNAVPIVSTQACRNELDWIDSSVWDVMSDDARSLVKKEASSQQTGKVYASVTQLRKLLQAMRDKKPYDHDTDQISIEAKCQRLANMKLTPNRGFHLVARLEDTANEEPVQIIFDNKLVTELLGVSHMEVIKLSKDKGQSFVATKFFKPLQEKLCSSTAHIELDLTVMETSPDGALMPTVTGFSELRLQAIPS